MLSLSLPAFSPDPASLPTARMQKAQAKQPASSLPELYHPIVPPKLAISLNGTVSSHYTTSPPFVSRLYLAYDPHLKVPLLLKLL